MVSRPLTRSARLARSAAAWVTGQIRRQFITRNRRMAFVLTVATLAIGVAAVHLSEWWFSPGLMILPVLAGGLLLWPRALRILFGLVAVMLLYDGLSRRAGPASSPRSWSPRCSLTHWPGPGGSSACRGCAGTGC